MEKDNFITVIAVFDDRSQQIMQNIREDFGRLYGVDTSAGDIRFHMTLGTYAISETDEAVSRTILLAKKTKPVKVCLGKIKHFGNAIRYLEPEMNQELIDLFRPFAADWKPHVTVYRHSRPVEIEVPEHIFQKVDLLAGASIVGIEVWDFFQEKRIARVMFEG